MYTMASPYYCTAFLSREINFVSTCFQNGETASDGRFAMSRVISIRQTVDRFTIGRCRALVRENMGPIFWGHRRCGLIGHSSRSFSCQFASWASRYASGLVHAMALSGANDAFPDDQYVSGHDSCSKLLCEHLHPFENGCEHE